MKKILIFILFAFAYCFIGYSSDEMNIKFIGENRWRDELDPKPGSLAVSTGINGMPYLTVGTLSNGTYNTRSIIIDPYAIRRNKGGNKVLELNKDYYLHLSPNTSISRVIKKNYPYLEFEVTHNNTNNVIFCASTCSSRVLDIESLIKFNSIEKQDFMSFFEISNPNVLLEANIMPNKLYLKYKSSNLKNGDKFKISIKYNLFRIYGSYLNNGGSMICREFDDFTIYDFEYKDHLGDISLGTMRAWVLSQISTLMPDKWSSCVANKDVKLDGNKLTFGLDMHDFNLNVSSKNSYHDVMSIANNTNSLIDFITVNPISSQNYHIKKYEVIDNNLHVWADDICKDPQLVIATGSLTENTKWINLENQQILPDLEEIDGKKYYHLVATLPSTVIDPKVSNNILISVKGVQPNTNGINKHVIIHANTWAEDSIIIKSKSGKWFKLVIDENDQLSIEQVNDSEINNK